MNPQPLEAGEAGYSSVVEALGLAGLSAEGRVQKLIETSPEIIASRISPGIMFSPLVDGHLIPSEPTFESINANPPWAPTSCEAIMVGYSPLDASVFGMMGLFQRKKGIAAAFATFVRSFLASHPQEAEKLLGLYGLGSGSTIDDDEAFISILRFATDIGYRAPAHTLAKTFAGQAYVLQFSEPNPWDGPFKGYTTHVLDVAFFFQNYNDHLSESQKATAVKLASDIFQFVHGNAPWDDFRKSEQVVVYQNGGRTGNNSQALTTEEYQGVLKVGDVVGLDTLANAVVAFVFAPPA
ncbi:hypothetical protein SBRCBS47491_009133 [Sporothrix bragantina]|uniref:Carboxylesterase type B domain-containing protein n=1 Tax=Sporothrix bragantina TaxID=671064 RepID=A0ABP0CUK7_9PEZI